MRWELSRSHSAAGGTNSPRWTSTASTRQASRSTRALSSRREKKGRALRRGSRARVKLAARALARSSRRSILRSSARRGFSASGRRPPPKRRRSGLRASAKATCPWCHGTLHGAAYSLRGFVPPDVAGFLDSIQLIRARCSLPASRFRCSPGGVRVVLCAGSDRSRHLSVAIAEPEAGFGAGRRELRALERLADLSEDGGFAGLRLGLGRLGRDAEIQQLTDDRASPSLGPVLPATVIDDHSSCDDHRSEEH